MSTSAGQVHLAGQEHFAGQVHVGASDINLASLAVGDVVAQRTVSFDRARLVRYAGASGDFNPIHWNPEFARSVGLESVIVHGMLTMGAAVTLVEDWVGDPGRIVDYQTRFTRPISVPDTGQVQADITASIGALNVDDATVRVDLTVTVDGAKVLGKAQALLSLAPAS